MDQASSVVCICETREHAQHAMQILKGAGIDMETVSLASKDVSTTSDSAEEYQEGDQTFAIAGIGSVLVSGPLASWIVTVLSTDRRAGGMSVAGEALATLGIPHDSLLRYEAALRADKHVLIVHGSSDAVARALKVIGGTTHCFHTVHGEKVFDTVHGRSLLTESAHGYQV